MDIMWLKIWSIEQYYKIFKSHDYRSHDYRPHDVNKQIFDFVDL